MHIQAKENINAYEKKYFHGLKRKKTDTLSLEEPQF